MVVTTTQHTCILTAHTTEWRNEFRVDALLPMSWDMFRLYIYMCKKRKIDTKKWVCYWGKDGFDAGHISFVSMVCFTHITSPTIIQTTPFLTTTMIFIMMPLHRTSTTHDGVVVRIHGQIPKKKSTLLTLTQRRGQFGSVLLLFTFLTGTPRFKYITWYLYQMIQSSSIIWVFFLGGGLSVWSWY